MAIDLTCPNCGSHGRVPDNAQGRAINCRRCGNTFEVPRSPIDENLAGDVAVMCPGCKRIIQLSAEELSLSLIQCAVCNANFPPTGNQVVANEPEQNAPPMACRCPHCQNRLRVPVSSAGAVLTCPLCNKRFQAPIPPPPVSQPSQGPKTPLVPTLIPQIEEDSDPLDFSNSGHDATLNPRANRASTSRWIRWKTTGNHSLLGILATITGGGAFFLILLSKLIYASWYDGLSPTDRHLYNVSMRDGIPIRELPKEYMAEFSMDLLFFAWFVNVLALLVAGLSFRSQTKRDWSIAGCVVNGLLFFWILGQVGLL